MKNSKNRANLQMFIYLVSISKNNEKSKYFKKIINVDNVFLLCYYFLGDIKLKKLDNNKIKNSLLIDAKVITVDETTSTNSDLKILAENGAEEWTILCAEKQTNGRGRMGNSFYSPEGGIYMSILLKPTFSPENSLFITTIAACSVCNAIEKLTNKNVEIKWVNDIYNKDGKICGILTESTIDYETNKLKYAILGIGLNVFPPENGFSKELKNIASTLLNNNEMSLDIYNHLISEIVNQFYKLYNNFDKAEHIIEYKNRSMLINKEIGYVQDGEEFNAIVIDIDSECHLIVSDSSGKITKLSSGEVKIKQW